MIIPVASSTELITDLVGVFWEVLRGPGLEVMGVLIVVSIAFWAFRHFRGFFGHKGSK